MEFTKFVRRPFEIEAIQITLENIEDIAPLVGRLNLEDKRGPFIEVDNTLVPNMNRVLPGYWLTKMGGNIRCYASKVFDDQFIEKPFQDDNCDMFAKVDFGHGPVEIRCTESGEHEEHWCEVRIFEDGTTKEGPSNDISVRS